MLEKVRAESGNTVKHPGTYNFRVTSCGHGTQSRRVFVGIETSAFSGATLLSFLLNSHPRIASIGEMDGLIRKRAEEYLCSCGAMIRNCEFWRALSTEMGQRGFEFDVADFAMRFRFHGPRWMQHLRANSFRNRILDRVRDTALKSLPGERRQFEQRVARNDAFIESVLQLTGKHVFVDTSKDQLRARALKLFSPYDVRVIHLVRDPRGVTASRLRRHSELTVRQAAREWVWLNRRLQNYVHLLTPAKYLRVRYEDLCGDPRSVLGDIYRFCDADPEFEPTECKSTVHHIIGNPMRLNSISAINVDERWREQLTDEQQREIWQVAGELAIEYGYSWR